jgi:hypothetical protein
VLFSLLYLVLRLFLRVSSLGGDRERELELELLVLRHELVVLKRKVGRPKLRRSDKLFLTALSRVAWLASPSTRRGASSSASGA